MSGDLILQLLYQLSIFDLVKSLNLVLQLYNFVVNLPLVGFKSPLLASSDFLPRSKNLLNSFLFEHHLIEVAESWLLLFLQFLCSTVCVQ